MYDLIIFDVDGTLVRTKSGAEFRKTADDWELIEGRADVLRQLKAAGKKIVLASNQGGIGMGYFPMFEMADQLRKLRDEIRADGLYYCPFHPDALLAEFRCSSFDRKPMPGMLLNAMYDQQAPAPQTLMIGDRQEDAMAARNAGVRFCHADDFFRDWRAVCKENPA